MAESAHTKTLIVDAFKRLLGCEPFSKVSVGDICTEAGLNRKSFYYHFKDKYDLVNSSFDMEFSDYASKSLKTVEKSEGVIIIKCLCEHLHTNRSYYRKLLEIECQNSFSDYLREQIFIYFKKMGFDTSDFKTRFFSDAVFFSIKSWLLAKSSEKPEDFVFKLLRCIGIDNRKNQNNIHIK